MDGWLGRWLGGRMDGRQFSFFLVRNLKYRYGFTINTDSILWPLFAGPKVVLIEEFYHISIGVYTVKKMASYHLDRGLVTMYFPLGQRRLMLLEGYNKLLHKYKFQCKCKLSAHFHIHCVNVKMTVRWGVNVYQEFCANKCGGCWWG